jgi:hypothetical protein
MRASIVLLYDALALLHLEVLENDVRTPFTYQALTHMN